MRLPPPALEAGRSSVPLDFNCIILSSQRRGRCMNPRFYVFLVFELKNHALQVRFGAPSSSLWVAIVGYVSPTGAPDLNGTIGWTDVELQATVHSNTVVSLQPTYFYGYEETAYSALFVDVGNCARPPVSPSPCRSLHISSCFC